jgi:hypothetical protein
MLSACVAAMALVSCNKEGIDPESTSLKSVKLTFENVIMTKGLAGDKIHAGSPVLVNNFKIFLTDGSYSQVYSAKTADGEDAVFYFTGETLADAKEYDYHFVDHKVTRVIAVANMGDKSFAEVKEFVAAIGDQQDQTSLVLWADSPLVSTGETETGHGSTDAQKELYTEVYEASLTLKPAISRFEVDGFSIKFSSTPKFNKIEVTDIAFDHYSPSMVFSTSIGSFKAEANGTHIKNVDDPESESDVFGWINNEATIGWFIDSFAADAVVMTPDNPETTDVYENRADAPDPLAYHFFSGNVVPTMYIKLLADGNPAYVYTSTFTSKETNTALNTIEPGKIYRMSAAGEVDQTGGSVPIPDDLDPIRRCLDITVEVADWVVELVTPEF